MFLLKNSKPNEQKTLNSRLRFLIQKQNASLKVMHLRKNHSVVKIVP